GRKDAQVKIRGHRIELGEIEETLKRDPSVRQAVVVLREQESGDQRLLAYLVADGKDVSSAARLRALLRSHLPDFMIPSSFVWLDSFPLTPSGKVDRKALPAPGLSRPELEDTF